MRATLFLFILAACSTPKPEIFTRQPLFEQRLAPRPGFLGLTNQVCLEKNTLGDCVRMDTLVYDLADPGIRKQLIDLKFICNVGGKRFRIDPFRNGLTSWTDPGLWRKYQEIDFIDFSKNIQRAINANTVCAAQDSLLGRLLFLR